MRQPDYNTVTFSRPLLVKLHQALRYGAECAEARRELEKDQARAWSITAVPFGTTDADVDEPESYFECCERIRRAASDELVHVLEAMVADMLTAEEMTF